MEAGKPGGLSSNSRCRARTRIRLLAYLVLTDEPVVKEREVIRQVQPTFVSPQPVSIQEVLWRNESLGLLQLHLI